MTRKLVIRWFPAVLAVTLAGAVPESMSNEPAEPVSTKPETLSTREVANPIDVLVGAGRVFVTPVDISRVALADESLATLTVLSPRQILIHGTLPGATSLFIWTEDERFVRRVLRVRLDLGTLIAVLKDIDESLEVSESTDSRAILLQGEVNDASFAMEAQQRTERFLHAIPDKNRPVVMNLIKYPTIGDAVGSDMRLLEALQSIDPRIRMRRIAVAGKEDADSLMLEGRVRSLRDLSRAVAIAERHLGGTGLQLKVADESRISSASSRSGGFGVAGMSDLTRGHVDQVGPGLANHLARRMVITSESGRVISFLEVDHIDQILVSIRVYEINRGRARQVGVNYRVDGRDFSAAQYAMSTRSRLPAPGAPAAPTVGDIGAGNLVGVLVRDYFSVAAAIDLMLEKNVARAVAEPNVLTLTGEKATVLVGGEVPIPITTMAQVATVRGFGFQSYGVRLDIRPTVDDDRVVTLEVAPSIVRPDRNLTVDEVPGFQVESVETTARVRDGQSLVLGGLLTYDEGISERKVPLLGSIPILGYLFKWERKFREERELVFVITPRILVDGEDGIADIHLPPLDSLSTGLNREREPQTLSPDGRPDLWTRPYYPEPEIREEPEPVPPRRVREREPEPAPARIRPSPAVDSDISAPVPLR